MLVSVIVPAFNAARFLTQALASATAQDHSPVEIIVVDDGSTDDSARIAAATAGIRLIQQEHQGVAAARNRGIAEARGELIAFLDADDWWTPDKLAVHSAFMIERPEIGYSFTHARVTLEQGVARPSWLSPTALTEDQPCVGTGSMMVRDWALERVGGFDPAHRTGEDRDWMARATDCGVPMAIVPAMLLHRRIHANNLSYHRPVGHRGLLEILHKSVARKHQTEHPRLP